MNLLMVIEKIRLFLQFRDLKMSGSSFNQFLCQDCIDGPIDFAFDNVLQMLIRKVNAQSLAL